MHFFFFCFYWKGWGVGEELTVVLSTLESLIMLILQKQEKMARNLQSCTHGGVALTDTAESP